MWGVKTYVFWPDKSIGNVYLTLITQPYKITMPTLIFEQQNSRKTEQNW